MTARVPHDLRLAPVLPQADHLLAWMHEPVGDAGIDETAPHRHERSKRQRRHHPPDGFGQSHRETAGVVVTEAGMAAQQLNQVGHRYTEDRAGEPFFEAGDQRRDVTAERETVQPDQRLRLLQPYPGQQPPYVPHRLSRCMHVVEDILARKHRALGQAARPGAVHREDGYNDVQTEIVVQFPGAEHSEIDSGTAHFGSVHTHQPGSRFRVAQQQCVFATVRRVSQPPFPPRLPRMRCVCAVEKYSMVRTSARLDLSDRDVWKRRGLPEKSLWLLQPPLVPVELQCCDHFLVDPLVYARLADRAARLQAHQDDLVTQSLRNQGDGGSCDRKVIRPLIEVIPPRLSKIPAGVHERPGCAAQISNTGWAQV